MKVNNNTKKTTRENNSSYAYYYAKPEKINYSYQYRNLLSHSENFKNVACPKCGFKLKFEHQFSNDGYEYRCLKCDYVMNFEEYQKRFINLNWTKEIKSGIRLYSWDGICNNCKKINPFITYCINADFGTEELCIYQPILLGSIPKIDNFLMRYCHAINLFPDENDNLSAHIFCSDCDAPVMYSDLLKSFCNQKQLDLEYTIKKELIKELNIKPEDISKSLNYLKLFNNE